MFKIQNKKKKCNNLLSTENRKINQPDIWEIFGDLRNGLKTEKNLTIQFEKRAPRTNAAIMER